MQASGLDHLELVLLLLVTAVAVLALIAKWLRIAYPIVLVVGGLLLSSIPHAPHVSMDPDVVFLVILPPLVFSAAFNTSWRDFRNNLVRILMLAFGLVGFTIFGVAGTTRFLLPGFGWKLGLVLGSVVAATDAIAATATAKRLGLPRGITDLLEAESLVNDGSGLVALRFTLALVVSGITPTVVQGVGTLSYLVFAAVAIGLVVGLAVVWLQRYIDDSLVETTVTLLTPYLAYLTAERFGCSGVLATLACGIYLGRQSSGLFSLHARIESSAVWKTLDFVLNGLVFLVLGLQLPSILGQIKGINLNTLIIDGALFSAIVILLRLLWVFPSAWISSFIETHLLRRKQEPISTGSIFLVGWAGMRGVLALAAALALPERLANGSAFPERNLIIFLTFCVIFATLVLQGLSMPVLIDYLGLRGRSSTEEEESRARRQMIVAALDALSEIRKQVPPEQGEFYDHLDGYYRRRLAQIEKDGNSEEHRSVQESIEQQRMVAQELRDLERSVALRLRNENQIHDEVLRTLERELDLLDARFAESD